MAQSISESNATLGSASERAAGEPSSSSPGDRADAAPDTAATAAAAPPPASPPPATPPPPTPPSAAAAAPPPATSTSSSGSSSSPAGLAIAALVLSVVALIVVITFWRQQSQLLQDLGSAREAAGAARADVASTTSSLERRLEERLGSQEARLRELEPLLAGIERTVTDLREDDDAIAGALRAQNERLGDAEQGVERNAQALADAGGVLRDARDRWILAEVEYLMQTANTSLQLNGDPRVALAALEAADDHLGTLANPQLTATREALAADLTALRAMPQPDVAGVAVTLAALGASTDALPLVEDRVVNYPLEGGDPEEAPGWERAWSALKGATSSMVSFRRDDSEVIPLLEPDERFFLRRNLELQIASARLAALNGDAVNYRLSIEAAQRTLSAGFDPEASAVTAMREQLAELWQIDIAPARPDISGSLIALRAANARLP